MTETTSIEGDIMENEQWNRERFEINRSLEQKRVLSELQAWKDFLSQESFGMSLHNYPTCFKMKYQFLQTQFAENFKAGDAVTWIEYHDGITPKTIDGHVIPRPAGECCDFEVPVMRDSDTGVYLHVSFSNLKRR